MKSLKTQLFVLGYPLSHTLSPLIHNYWLELYKKKENYKALEVKPENFDSFWKTLKNNQYLGGNITLPYKERAFQLSDYKDPIAQKIGAANCLWREKEKICATNTDVYGFLTNLDKQIPHWQAQKILVLGAGGAARAVLYALLQRDVEEIYLTNRNPERAYALKGVFGKKIKILLWEEREKPLGSVDLIVNATAFSLEKKDTHPTGKEIAKGHVSRTEKIKQQFPLDFSKAKANALAYDLVYRPLKTQFLVQAEQAGLQIVDGLGMLIYQAVPCFTLWFGIEPEVTEGLKQKIMDKINS